MYVDVYLATVVGLAGWTAGFPLLFGMMETCSGRCWWSAADGCPASGGHRPPLPGWTLFFLAWTENLRKTNTQPVLHGPKHYIDRSIDRSIDIYMVSDSFLYIYIFDCVLVLTLCQVALRQSIGDVWKLATIVSILQWADVHVTPFLQLLKPATLLLAFTMRV